jgi:hypothetical protein
MPTRSDAYKLARDVIIPEIRRITSQLNGEHFLLPRPLQKGRITAQGIDCL